MKSIEIRAYHCDAYAHVNNARWAELLDEGRWQFWTNKPWFDERGWWFEVSELNIKFKRKGVMGDVITLTSQLHDIEISHAWLTQTASNQRNKACVTAEVKLVVMSRDGIVPIEGELLEALQSL